APARPPLRSGRARSTRQRTDRADVRPWTATRRFARAKAASASARSPWRALRARAHGSVAPAPGIEPARAPRTPERTPPRRLTGARMPAGRRRSRTSWVDGRKAPDEDESCGLQEDDGAGEHVPVGALEHRREQVGPVRLEEDGDEQRQRGHDHALQLSLTGER